MGVNIKEQEEIFRIAQSRGSSGNKKIKSEKKVGGILGNLQAWCPFGL